MAEPMKIQPAAFQKAFVQRAVDVLPQSESESFRSTPLDQSTLSVSESSDNLEQRFSQAVLAVATSAQIAGIPTLAALSQEIGQSLISSTQESEHGRSIASQLSGLPRQESKLVNEQWEQVAEVTDSKFSSPEVIDSFFVYAQSDSTGMYIGTRALEKDLADQDALAFTLAHEEAHRVHRDSAGAKGLETLVSVLEKNEELYPHAFQALAEGRHQNEREADLFAVQALQEMGRDLAPVWNFLDSMPGDLQHPPGPERVAFVKKQLDLHN